MTGQSASQPLRRVRRFFRTLCPRVEPAALAAGLPYLSPAEQALFRRLAPADEQHSLRVFALLVANDQTDRDLLGAALLHDAGKAHARLSVWHRVVVDLAGRHSPGILRWLAGHGPAWWRGPFTVALTHSTIGIADLTAAGSSTRLIDILASAGSPARQLQSADAPTADTTIATLAQLLREADARE